MSSHYLEATHIMRRRINHGNDTSHRQHTPACQPVDGKVGQHLMVKDPAWLYDMSEANIEALPSTGIRQGWKSEVGTSGWRHTCKL